MFLFISRHTILCGLLLLSLFCSLGTLAQSIQESKYEGIDITVNVNTASADEISTLLIGIGKKKAEDIVSYRDLYGKFENVEALTQVKGIGSSTLEKNRNRILLK